MITTVCNCGAVVEQYTPEGQGNQNRFQVGVCEGCLKKIGEAWLSLTCPPLYMDTDPARLCQPALARLKQINLWKKGVMLVGPSRAGKTRLMWYALKEISRGFTRKNHNIIAFDAVSFGHELARAYKRGDGEEWIHDVQTADIVAFDDLGKEKLTDRAEAELFGVIEYRMAWKLPILCTTEHSPDGLVNRVSGHRGPALVNRLKECCEVIQVI